MKTDTCFNLRMSFCCLIVLLYSLQAAGDSCISSMVKKNPGAAAACLFELELVKAGNDWSGRTVNWTLFKAQEYMDEQCPLKKGLSHVYCCSTTVHLKCVQCCSGSRPNGVTLQLRTSKCSITVYWLAPVLILSVVVIGVIMWILFRKRKSMDEGENRAPIK